MELLNRRVSRLIISAFLILSSIAPWQKFYSGVQGPPSVSNGFSVFKDIIYLFSNPDIIIDRLSPLWAGVSYLLVQLSGQLIVFWYIGLSVSAIFHSKMDCYSKRLSKWIILLLFISAIPVTFHIVFQYNSSAGWGAWGMLICIGLAITIEIMSMKSSEKLHNPRST
ncbi:MAG: hypothetical protein MUO76_03060 [Anaerolineaceae bacterium]|nr:hypothetical protein [Anaerolineaceae bacterium]